MRQGTQRRAGRVFAPKRLTLLPREDAWPSDEDWNQAKIYVWDTVSDLLLGVDADDEPPFQEQQAPAVEPGSEEQPTQPPASAEPVEDQSDSEEEDVCRRLGQERRLMLQLWLVLQRHGRDSLERLLDESLRTPASQEEGQEASADGSVAGPQPQAAAPRLTKAVLVPSRRWPRAPEPSPLDDELLAPPAQPPPPPPAAKPPPLQLPYRTKSLRLLGCAPGDGEPLRYWSPPAGSPGGRFPRDHCPKPSSLGPEPAWRPDLALFLHFCHGVPRDAALFAAQSCARGAQQPSQMSGELFFNVVEKPMVCGSQARGS